MDPPVFSLPAPARKRALARLSVLVGLFILLGSLPAAAAERPSLVVVISVDQMRPDYLERFRPWFGKDGWNRFLERGAVFPQARHRHAIAETAPGHAAIGTGLDPRNSGILSNRRFDEATRKDVSYTSDPGAEWVGPAPGTPKPSGEPASPVLLDRASLGDRLKEKFPAARVVGVALKDRSAVFMAGRKADAAVWMPESFGRFVTSSYYPPRPSLLKFNARLRGFFSRRKSWRLSGRIPASELARVTFDLPELARYKDPLDGMGDAFPHPLATSRAVLYSPFGDELILAFARHAIEDFGLGRNAAGAPDLLFIGMSSLDFYGHRFGPDSREVADGVVRLDAELEAFFRWLDGRVPGGRVLIFLTSDHGVTPIPEVALARAGNGGAPDAAGRLSLANGPTGGAVRNLGTARLALERHLVDALGYELELDRPNLSEGAVAWFDDGYLYLNRPILARRGLPLAKVRAEARDFLRTLPGVRAVYTNTELLDGLPASEPDGAIIERSFRADRAGDLLVILKPGWTFAAKGASHGQPTDDDLRVPLLAWGARVKAGSWEGKVSPISIAKTVAAIFGFEVGEPDAEILEPVLGREARRARTQ